MIEKIDDGLEYLIAKQKELQEYLKKHRDWYNDATDSEKLFIYAYALLDEVTEFIRELNWKPWKNKKKIDEKALKEELIDILHFWLALSIQLNMSGNEILTEYLHKNSINKRRQINEEGYKSNK